MRPCWGEVPQAARGEERPTLDGERLADAVRERIQGVEFAGGAIGLSVGVTHVRPDETLSAEGFLRRAEQALQEAKRQDRSRSALFMPGSAMRGVRRPFPSH